MHYCTSCVNGKVHHENRGLWLGEIWYDIHVIGWMIVVNLHGTEVNRDVPPTCIQSCYSKKACAYMHVLK